MAGISDKFIFEFEIESKTTLRLLEAMPDDKMTWKPHPKSFSLGGLTHHIVTIPSLVIGIAKMDTFDLPAGPQETCLSKQETIQLHHENVQIANEELAKMDDAYLQSEWKLVKGDQVIMTMPRIGVIHSFFFNHYYHHRGQLTVYLRLLDVPVPSVYGPTADVNPFA